MLTSIVLLTSTGVIAVAQDVRQPAHSACQKLASLFAPVIHMEWAKGNARSPSKMGSPKSEERVVQAIWNLWTEMRHDPALSRMTKEEFIAFSVRTCEPIYEGYFLILSRKPAAKQPGSSPHSN
jgi:hypothetical protein